MEYYPRKIEKSLDRWMERREIILIKGPRQSGKTTLLLHLREKYGGRYVTLEDEDILSAIDRNPKGFISRFAMEKLILIDESQYLKSIGKTLKFFYDCYPDKKFVVTGSGSFDVKVEVGKYLVGRAAYFELLPLDFEEFIMWKAKDLHSIFLDYKKGLMDFLDGNEKIESSPVFEREFNGLLEEYLIYGGFPAVVKESDFEIKRELLKNLVRTYLEKDIFFFFDVMHISKFRDLLAYLSFNMGSLLDLSSICRDLRMDYRTLEKYISILSNTYFIYLLSPFYKNLSTELKKTKKVYILDNGLRNSILGNFLDIEKRSDKGIIIENFIFNEILRNIEGKLNYWRTTGKAEVDFVLSRGEEIIPIEVKGRAEISKSFLSFLKTYRPRRAIVFNEKDFDVRKIKETLVAFLPYFYI